MGRSPVVSESKNRSTSAVVMTSRRDSPSTGSTRERRGASLVPQRGCFFGPPVKTFLWVLKSRGRGPPRATRAPRRLLLYAGPSSIVGVNRVFLHAADGLLVEPPTPAHEPNAPHSGTRPEHATWRIVPLVGVVPVLAA